jgi:hypothetical protein
MTRILAARVTVGLFLPPILALLILLGPLAYVVRWI